MVKRIFLSVGLIGCVLVGTGTATWSAEPFKIGVIDGKKCVEESEAGKKILHSFQQKFDRTKKELDRRNEELKKLQGEFVKKSSILNPDAKREKEKELARKVEDFRDMVREKEAELQQEQNSALQALSNELFQIAVGIGKEEGYALILEAKSGVVYHTKTIDLTDKVLKAFNAKKEKR